LQRRHERQSADSSLALRMTKYFYDTLLKGKELKVVLKD
jgi:hypothetical protein